MRNSFSFALLLFIVMLMTSSLNAQSHTNEGMQDHGAQNHVMLNDNQFN